MNRRSTGRWHALLLAAMLLGFLLRMAGLGTQSLWYDEGVTAAVSQQRLADLTRWTADDIQPPLYYLLLNPWTRVMGASEWALRFPSVVAGVLGLALLYALARRLWLGQLLIARGLPGVAGAPTGPAHGAAPRQKLAGSYDTPHDPQQADGPPGALGSTAANSWVAPRVPWLTVFLAAIAPQWVYYSQEARNYTLLTCLGMVCAYLLLRVIGTPRTRRRRALWVALVIAALAALYTHYFALFLLAALALFYAVIWWCDRGQRRLRAIEGLLAAAAVVIGYLFWLPFLLTRFQVDTSYWQGTLKLGESLRHLIINSTMGAPEMVLEPVAVGLLLVWAGVALAALAGIWQTLRQPATPRHAWLRILFAVLYLVVPVACVLLLAYSTPKFNPRYTMLATSALFLLLGLGLGQPRLRALSHVPYPQLAVLAIVATSALALRNWYVDPVYAKADWRGVAQVVRAQIAADEAVVLVSGHAAPVWQYYAPDIPTLRLPNIDVLDVNQVLGYDAATALQTGLAGKTGAWLVTWQDDVVDPVGFAADLLGRAGRELPQPQHFQQVGLRHFALPTVSTFSSEPPVESPVHANFDNLVELLGWRMESCPQPPCALRLDWQALRPGLPDLKLAGEVVDAQGHVWARVPDQRLVNYQYPTTRWPAQHPVFGHITLPWWQGTPPGTYDLNLRVYAEGDAAARNVLDAAGNPQGQAVRLPGIEVTRTVTTGLSGPAAPAGAITSPSGNSTRLTTGVSLLEYWLAPAIAEPGQPLDLTVRYQLTPPYAEGGWQMQWHDPEGRPAASMTTVSTDHTGTDQPYVALAQLSPRVPVTATAGTGTLQLTRLDATGVPVGDVVEIPVQVRAGQRSFDLPVLDRPVNANFAGQLLLAGVLLPTNTAAPGAILPVTLIWQTIDPPESDLTAFVQLLDASGRLVAQAPDMPPADRPTSAWLPGEVVSSTYTLTLPADLAPGTYQVIAGLYDAQAAGMPRLRLVPGGAGHAVVGELAIP